MAIVGTGYVGLVSGTCFAGMGNKVTCVDVDRAKVDKLLSDGMPIYEPGLEDLVRRSVAYGRLHFTTDITKILGDIEVVFSAVGTPPDGGNGADLKYMLTVAREFGRNISRYTILIAKGTVPMGTAKKVRVIIQEELDKRDVNIPFDVALDPEFLKEGVTIKDFMSPDRVVVDVESKQAEEVMTKLYHPFLTQNFRIVFMDIPSTEMTKYAANAMLATHISFMNDIASLCECMRANVDDVRKGIGADVHIGQKFLYVGYDYGGSCFLRDVKALIHSGIDNGCHVEVIEAIEHMNGNQKAIVYNKFLMLIEDMEDRTAAVLGLAFRPETDDMREAPALVIIEKLLEAGASIRVFDPVAMPECKRRIDNAMTYCESMYDAADGASASTLMTEWRQFRMPTWSIIKKCMKGNVVMDGRNIYSRQELERLGFVYIRIGEK